MAAQDKVTFKQDLTEPVKIRHYEGVAFTGDDCGNLIKVALFDGGVPYSGGGTVSATAVLADGTTFPLTQGSLTGNMVSVPLEAGALVVSGLMGLYVKISGGGIICTVLNAIFTVQVTDTGRVPTATVTTVAELVQDIKDAQDSFPADLTNLLAAVAPTFSTSTAYSAGAYVWQGGKLYKFTAAHPAGTWTGTDAVEVALGNDVADLKSAIERDSSISSSNLMGIDVQQNLYPGAADWSGEWIRNNATTFLIDDTITFDGYPVVKDSVSWRSIKKDIPVESGKTYTFQAYVKAADASDLRVYIDSPNNPATTSEISKQYTGTPNNVWTRIAFSFSCTASGNVRPCILSTKNGDFYIAKYSLVEGDKVFSLSDALDNKVTKNEISAIGDYEKYSFSLGTSVGAYWNNYIDKNISAGDKIRLIFGSYSGNSALKWVNIDGKKSDGTWDNNVVGMSSPVHGGEAVGFASNNYVQLRVQFYRATDESNVTGSVLIATNRELGITNDLLTISDALDDKVAKQEISAFGDYEKYSFSLGTSTGVYWNNYIDKVISAGDKIKLVFDNYSGNSALKWVKIDGKKSDNTWENNILGFSNPVHGDEAIGFASSNYVQLRVQFYRATDESNVTGSVLIATNRKLGITNDLLTINSNRVFHIAKDGSGDFTSFVDGINEACKYMDSVVYVGAGTYDLLDELGAEYVSGASSSQMGLVLKNRVHVICSSQTILKMDYDGSLSNAKEYLSPINTGEYGCTLENATIIDNNVRYSIHDDRGWSGSTPYTNKFINCTLIHKNGKYGDCIGGGLGENAYIEIRGCYLEGDTGIDRLAYYHGNNHTGVTNAKGHIVVADNYFAGIGTFKLTNYGDSTEVSTAYVSNNSFGTAPSITNGGYPDPIIVNMQMIAWNNEIRQ